MCQLEVGSRCKQRSAPFIGGFGQLGKFPDNLENFSTAWKVFLKFLQHVYCVCVRPCPNVTFLLGARKRFGICREIDFLHIMQTGKFRIFKPLPVIDICISTLIIYISKS